MSSDIATSLQLDKEFKSGRVIVVKELHGCDSTFVTSFVLSHYIKSKTPVLIISTHSSLLHYQNVGLKMNYNLQKYIDADLVHFYNCSDEFLNALLKNKECPIQILCFKIKQVIDTIKERHGFVNIILDGVSHLFDLQYTLKEINDFCKEIIASVRECKSSYVLCICNVASEDDVTHVMANLLSHKAHTIVEVESLSSGWSTDVSGHLTIKHPGCKFEDENMFIMDLKMSRFLFKLFDRGVKLFAPGTI